MESKSTGQYFQRLTLLGILSLLGAHLLHAAELAAEQNAVNLTTTSFYAPRGATCPIGSLLRPAVGLSPGEWSYVQSRKRKADRALSNWLEDQIEDFDVNDLPLIALTTSGGGVRSLLLGAGVVQAFDSEDSDDATNGLYQAFTYHAGLSGGAWLLASLIGNGFATVSDLAEELWHEAFPKNSLWPDNTKNASYLDKVKRDMYARSSAGFTPTATDAYGRYLAYQLLRGPEGGISKTLSSLINTPSFRMFAHPYPIITALGINNITGSNCMPADDALQYEFTVHEFGSWVSNFLEPDNNQF